MISLLAPIGIFISKVVLQDILTDEVRDRIENKVEDRIEDKVEDRIEDEVEDRIEDEVENHISAAEDEEIKRPLRQYWKECYTIFIINIVLLIIASVVVPWFATSEITRYIVFSVYFSIVIHSFFKWSRRSYTFLKFVVLYQCSLKKMVRSKMIKHRERAKRHVRKSIRSSLPKVRLEIIENSTFWRRLFLSDEEVFIIARDKLLKSEEDIINKLLKSEEGIINRLYDTIWDMLFVYGSKIVLAVVFYILMFRLLVAPRIEDATGLSYIDSAIYPFIASIEYFFGSDFLNSIGNFFGFDFLRLLGVGAL